MRCCGVCFYGRFVRQEDEGDCMNKPPVLFMEPDGAITQARPRVGRSDWCFFFSHRKEIPPAPPAARGDGPR